MQQLSFKPPTRVRVIVLLDPLRSGSFRRICLILKSADNYSDVTMKTFGTVLSEARKAKGISPQYLNDIEHDRRNPPSEFIIGQMAVQLDFDKDTLCLAAGTISSDLMKMAASSPDKVQQAFKAFRKTVKGG
jgi:hypothetical protein